jgi:small subunit ribosomal protein S19e
MTTAYDVPANRLITSVAAELKSKETIKPPEWASIVKTGPHREKGPEDSDWWYTRVAAVLRKVYMCGPIGSSQLAAKFGGSVDRGSKPYHAWTGGRSIIRTSLQQLEESGLVVKDAKKGRKVSPEGQRLLDNAAHGVFQELVKEKPQLQKYG